MPRGPRGEYRPAKTVGTAVRVATVAAGKIEEVLTEEPGRTLSSKAGTQARAEKLTAGEWSGIAKKAAITRWG